MAAVPIVEKLPTELKQCLLSAISDIPTLRSIALSCSSYYHAFRNAESLITAQVLQKQVDVDVLPEAIAAAESSHLQPRTKQRARDFIRHHLHSRTAPAELWTLPKALLILRARLPGQSTPPNWRLSKAEINRIYRAFYRFEVYCNLFRDAILFNLNEQRDLFFSRFSNWENEQLACVHDYLFRLASFNNTAEHADWAHAEVESVDVVRYGDEHDSPNIEYVLSLGLERLQQFVTTKSHSMRFSLLGGESYPRGHFTFLAEGLMDSNELDDGTRLWEYEWEYEGFEHGEVPGFHPPFLQESDTGPADAWRWAHPNETRAHFVYSTNQKALRARGSCMWDLARIVSLPTFHHHWTPPPKLFSRTQRLSLRGEMEQCVYWRSHYGAGRS